MFEYLRRFDRILVTGPQRSGTRICAKMIAHDLDYRYVDEREFGTGDFWRLQKLLDEESEIVVQCPALSSLIHALEAPNIVVVYMSRSLGEIAASERRIKWSAKAQRKMFFDLLHEIPIAELKQMLWSWQQGHMGRSCMVHYESLSAHPLWVDKKEREGWAWDQTSCSS